MKENNIQPYPCEGKQYSTISLGRKTIFNNPYERKTIFNNIPMKENNIQQYPYEEKQYSTISL